MHIVKCTVYANSTTSGTSNYTTGSIYLNFVANTSTKATSYTQLRKVWGTGTGVWIPVFGYIYRTNEDDLHAPIVGIRFSQNSFDLMSYPSVGDSLTSNLRRPIITSGIAISNFQVSTPYQVVPLVANWASAS